MKKSTSLSNILSQIKEMDIDSTLEVVKILSDKITIPENFIIHHKTKTVFPILNVDECKMNGLESLLNELIELSGQLYLPIKYFGDIKLNFKFSDTFRSKDFQKTKTIDLFLIVDSKIDINLAKTAKLLNDIGTSPPNNIKTEFFVIPYFKLLYKTYLTHFIYMTQIAFPGSLFLDKALIFSGNKRIDHIEAIASILNENGYYNHKWPKLTPVRVSQVWNYVIKNTKILTEFSKTSIERAFNSFSYLFSANYHKDIPVSLFWAISGLESIFVSGEVGITQQLNEKIQVFLGDIKENKRLLKNLYNYRSSLIHGTLSIPLNSSIVDDEKYNNDLYEMNTFAALVLVASLQKIVKNDIVDLNFRYTYE